MRDLTRWARSAKRESTVRGRKPPDLHVDYGSFAAGVGMDATTPSPSDLTGVPTGSMEVLPKALQLPIPELVNPAYRELKAADWLFWKNALLLTTSGALGYPEFGDAVLAWSKRYAKRKSRDLIPIAV